ncbi:MAG TPA: hypothetical protein VJ776_00280 [Thermoanaerobaculia bacterium]|nr:hypothetical protein [Thermoanaerobaculia bacterium]
MSLAGRVLLLCLAIAGLALYLWPAIVAPPVLFSDSHLDLEWARTGAGIWKPIGEARGDAALHPAKPGYLLFLRAAMNAAPRAGQERSVILVQSLLLWVSIAGTSLYIGRRKGPALGIALYVILMLFLRLRDSASHVMSEAISAAGFLPLIAVVLFPPVRRRSALLLAGAGMAALFWVRPNVGLVALLVGTVAVRRLREIGLLAGGFVAIALPVWLVTRPAAGNDALRGLAHPLFAATAEYYWLPTLGPWPEGTAKERAGEELRRASANWRALLARRDADARRELVWRALHGFFGIEFYDATWSPAYARLTAAARLAAPFLILASIALLTALPFRDTEKNWNLAAVFLLLLLLAQNFLMGSHPRYVLPFLPGVFLLALAGLSSRTPRPHWIAALLAASALAFLLGHQRGALGWEWGRVESPGVVLRQPISRGALPATEPATLHIRIAAPSSSSGARMAVSVKGRRIWSSEDESADERPVIAVPLPPWLLEENGRAGVELDVTSFGDFGTYSYLLFPVVPPTWGRTADRKGSDLLSPTTGVRSGSLDWWAHAGRP